MPDQPLSLAKNDDFDDVLVKEPDGTFHVVKMQSSTANPPTGVPLKPSAPALPRVFKPAPLPMALAQDETKELAVFVEKTKALVPAASDQSETIARQAIKNAGVTLPDPSLADRLVKALVAFIKEVRKERETRELLVRPKEQGGLALAMPEAMRLLSLLKPPITKLADARVVTGQAPITKPADIPRIVLEKASPPAPKAVLVPLPPLHSARPSALTPITKLADARVVTGQTKPVVQDVSFTPKLTGPVDELAMTLLDWRRMAPTVKDRVSRIEEKLRLLSEESYAERVKGVAAWYGSDAVRAYHDIGQSSLQEGKPVAAIIASRAAAGQPSLSEEEFLSIAELNERIRF